MSFSKPKMPKPPPVMAPSVITGDTSQFQRGPFARLRRRLASMYGKQSTILTSASGGRSQTLPIKTLLGS